MFVVFIEKLNKMAIHIGQATSMCLKWMRGKTLKYILYFKVLNIFESGEYIYCLSTFINLIISKIILFYIIFNDIIVKS